MKTLRLGTRKSALAQAQANWVKDRLCQAFPELRIELILITTSGDQRTAVTPAKAGVQKDMMDSGVRRNDGPKGGLKALFTKEIEESLLDNKIDLAVHSMKDLAAELPAGLTIGAVPKREDPRDVWISKKGVPFGKLPKGSAVGTGAVRREAQLKHLRPDLKIVPLRGNVDTRLRKLFQDVTPVKTGVHELMDSGFRRNDENVQLDGIILAAAGLSRLGRLSEATEKLAEDVMLPAVGQGCLAIETRQGEKTIALYLKSLDDSSSHQAALAERAFLKELGGSCQTPIAGHASIQSGELMMRGLVISPDGQQILRAREDGRPFDAEGIGARLAQKLLEIGAGKLLKIDD